MSKLAAYATKAFDVISFYFNKYCAPNPKYFPDKVLYDTEHNRYKSLVLIQWLAFVGFIMNLLTANGDPGPNIQGLMGTSFMSAMFFFTNHFRLHPQIIKVTYNLYVLFFAPLLITNGEHGILGACLAVPMFPILVYLVTGGIGHFFFHLVCQTMFMSTFYQDFLRRGFAYMSVDETVRAMTYYVHQNLQYTFIFTGIIHYTIHTASYKIRIAEKKKDDFEKQKNFLLGFSHELRNLINSLMGNVKLAFLENPSEKVKDLLVNAEVCGELLLHLVNNILDTGKVEIGELEINPAPRKVYDTLERIWSVCSELIKRKNLRGIFKIQKDIPEMLIFDHYRITQVLMNLVGNAVKYTDLGHINICIEWIPDKDTVTENCFKPYPFNDMDDQEEGIFEKNQALSIFDNRFIILNFGCRQIDKNKIAARTDAKKGILKISITDSGIGILKEDLIKIFERFTQGITDPSKSKLGTGLGLFITKELCHRMNGEIRVFSKRNFGSAFIVCVPLEPVPNERAFFFDLEGIQRVIVEQQKIRTLIVDDETLSQLILKDFLSKLNVEVVDVAENGLKACEKFEEIVTSKEYINMVTMDLTMPVMDGKAAAQRIREIERSRNLEPCLMIIISGNCTESEIAECLDKNGRIRADAFVKKPVSLDELCRIISSHFAHLYDKQRVRLLAE